MSTNDIYLSAGTTKHVAEHVAIANATSRNRGAVGARAIVPRVVRERYGAVDNDGLEVLDFGAGKDAAHARAMQAAYGDVHGWQVRAWEFGDNVGEHHIQPEQECAHRGRYHVVYLSNVLNVQSSWSMLHRTIREAQNFLRWTGDLVCNYPESPRKSDLTVDEVEQALRAYFASVERVAGTNRAPVWVCTNREDA